MTHPESIVIDALAELDAFMLQQALDFKEWMALHSLQLDIRSLDADIVGHSRQLTRRKKLYLKVKCSTVDLNPVLTHIKTHFPQSYMTSGPIRADKCNLVFATHP